MIYDMECESCGRTYQIACSIVEHEDKIKPGIICDCGKIARQVILGKGSGLSFMRESFPKNDPRWEHASDNNVRISCKSQLKDICEANGSISRYLEDAC